METGPGKSFFTYTTDLPFTPARAQGLLAAFFETRPSYQSWYRAHISNTTMSMYVGWAYEAATLFGHALHQLTAQGKPAIDGPGLAAALKNVSVTPGVTTERVSLRPDGERDSRYALMNFVGSAWRAVGHWDADTSKLVLSGPMPGCECNGWASTTGKYKGVGAYCARWGYVEEWCYVNATCGAFCCPPFVPHDHQTF